MKFLLQPLKTRQVFHSEADFQHHLAMQIEREVGGVRLEMPLSPNQYCDIVVRSLGFGIELKYKTKARRYRIDGEDFNLKHQSAQDLGRFYFLKDLERLEAWKAEGKIANGFAIFLTNDSAYWTPPKQAKPSNCENFRLHNRIVKSGVYGWSKDSFAEGKTVTLTGMYKLDWQDTKHPDFKVLLVEV